MAIQQKRKKEFFNFYIFSDQLERLKKISSADGSNASDLIRRAIDKAYPKEGDK